MVKKEFKIIEKKEFELLKDFLRLYKKIKTKEKLNYYDKVLIEILEEFNMYIDYKKEWSKRKYND